MLSSLSEFIRVFVRTPFFWVLSVAVSIRAILWIFRTEDYLQETIEFVQPTRSFKRVEEALFLEKSGVGAYSSVAYKHPPLSLLPFLFLYHPVVPRWVSAVLMRLTLVVLDAATSWMIGLFVAQYSHFSLTKTPALFAASLYILNPFTILTTVGLTSVPVRNFLLMFTLWASVKGWITGCMFALAVLVAVIDIHLICLWVPLVMILAQIRKYTEGTATVFGSLIILGGFLTFFYFLSSFVLGSNRDMLIQLFTGGYTWRELNPNWGLYWYLFMEMFLDFRSFWVWVFQCHLWMYPIPILIRFYPLDNSGVLLYVIYMSLYTILMPLPTFGDYTFIILMLYVTNDAIFTKIRAGFALAGSLMVFIAIGPVFFHSWAYSGTGNANFFYFITLGFNLVMVNMITGFMKVALMQHQENEEKKKDAIQQAREEALQAAQENVEQAHIMQPAEEDSGIHVSGQAYNANAEEAEEEVKVPI